MQTPINSKGEAMKYIPTADEVALIKKAAAKEGGLKLSRVLLEPAIRHNLESDRGKSMNIAMVSDDPEWNDTDLFDYGYWSDFRKGVDLTEDGRGIFDFYIRARFTQSHEDDLWGNVSIEIKGGKLYRIHGYGNSGDYFKAV